MKASPLPSPPPLYPCFSLLPHSSLPSSSVVKPLPQPTTTDFPHPWKPCYMTCELQDEIRRSTRVTPVRDRFGSVLRQSIHSTHRRFLCLCRCWGDAFSCANCYPNLATTVFRLQGWRSFSLGNPQHVENDRRSPEKYELAPKIGLDQNIQPPASGVKMQISTCGTCIFFSESRAIHSLFPCCWGGEGGGRQDQSFTLHGSLCEKQMHGKCYSGNAESRLVRPSQNSGNRSESFTSFWPGRSSDKICWAVAMVLKMADFCKSPKSSQTPWYVAYRLANGFLTVYGLVRNDSGRL